MASLAAASPIRREASFGRLAEWLRTPAGALAGLIAATLLARLGFAWLLGLGIDESYMVAAGRHLQLSYFDHPPAAWWMAWTAAHLAGNDSPFVVRLPFVLLFCGTTWLMFALTRRLFDARAGFWAAVLLNLAPVFGITTASWVLPDGPMLAALLAAALCLAAALEPAKTAQSWRRWLGVGLCTGLALFSKYTAVLDVGGAVLFLLTTPGGRRWLRRPHPYVAGMLALLVFSPVLIWNARHGWMSLLFQGGRAAGGRWHPFGPLTTLAGQSLFLLPWIWAPMMLCLGLAVRDRLSAARPADPRQWLLACLALPAIVLFLLISLRTRVLFHWASPGYVMLLPLLGAQIAARIRVHPALRAAVGATACLALVGVVVAGTEVRFNWLPDVIEDFGLGHDPDMGAVDWTSLRQALLRRGWLAHPGLIVATVRWHDAGKVDYALGGAAKVVCLGRDPREYGVIARTGADAGQDMLIVAPRYTLRGIRARLGGSFQAIEPLPEVMLLHAGRPAMILPLYLGRDFSSGAPLGHVQGPDQREAHATEQQKR
ncbi:glycosyltransferase family 39 protein [Lichenicoccus sp.]|uniref:glycosyltransferase family 39 protein n=1 Tax=Lichenicoccus sp. TaxID=2781899 RepID=UPI003D0FA34A